MISTGHFSDGEHHVSYPVYYEDTDAGGIVYHANYLKFAERARTDALRTLGFSQRILAEGEGVIFVVTHCDISYRRPAVLEDILTVKSRLIETSKVRMTLEQTIHRDLLHLATLRIRLAALDKSGKAVEIPNSIVQELRTHMSQHSSDKE